MAVKSFILNLQDFVSRKNGNYINKFMPLERALNFLNNECLWFANPETWPDPFEKRFLCSFYSQNKRFGWYGRVFCSCFTNNSTSEASWKAYSKDEICIQFTFDRKELLNSLKDFSNNNPHYQVYFDKVEYMKTSNISGPIRSIPFEPQLNGNKGMRSMELKERLLLLKRKSFEYEQEFRAIIVKPNKTREMGILVPVDIHNLIRDITIGPTVQNDTFKMLKDLFVQHYKFDSKKVHRSYLYKNLPDKLMIK